MCRSQNVSEAKVQNLANQTELSAQGQPALSKGFCSLPGSIIHWKWAFVRALLLLYVSVCTSFRLCACVPLCVLHWIKMLFSRAIEQNFTLLKVSPLFWTLGFRLVIYAEWNASEFMNEGLITDQLGVQSWASEWERFGSGGRLSSDRVQGVYDWVVDALWHSLSWWCLAPPPSWSSLLIILPADGILKSDLAGMGFSVMNLPGSHEKMPSTQEILTLRGMWTKKQILIHLPKINLNYQWK